MTTNGDADDIEVTVRWHRTVYPADGSAEVTTAGSWSGPLSDLEQPDGSVLFPSMPTSQREQL